MRLSPITLVVCEGQQSLPIGRSPSGVESGCAEGILTVVNSGATCWDYCALDIAGRFPAPSRASHDRQ
jgi:hypothetical protein